MAGYSAVTPKTGVMKIVKCSPQARGWGWGGGGEDYGRGNFVRKVKVLGKLPRVAEKHI